MVSTNPRQRNFVTLKLVIYSVIIFFLSLGIGEGLARSFVADSPEAFNPLQRSNYYPAFDHLTRIKHYVAQNGAPDCIFFGNSLVQIGLNPELFATAFQATSGQTLRCYNAGMDGSSLSSTVPMALLLAQEYHPSYIILGVQRKSFALRSELMANLIAEDQFHQNGWLQYQLGHFNVEGWIVDNSVLYPTLVDAMLRLFPTTAIDTPQRQPSVPRIRPEVPRIINPSGYAPLAGYRDTSPYVQLDSDAAAGPLMIIDPKDLVALDQLMAHAKNDEFHLIVVEMPVHSPVESPDDILRTIEDLVRQDGIPFLSTYALTPLPRMAYADQTHMHISGSFMFSDWLGEQIGTAVADEADVYAPLWSPTTQEWNPAIYTSTLGLNPTSYTRYQEAVKTFDLVPEDAILFNPSSTPVDKVFMQSLLGFSVEWVADRNDNYRAQLLQLMVVLDRMRFQDELGLPASQVDKIEQWYTTLDTSLLHDSGIEYVVCREELAHREVTHCPVSLKDHPDYTRIAQWNFDPIYESYSLYQVISPR